MVRLLPWLIRNKLGYPTKIMFINLSTSTFGVLLTGASSARNLFKGIASPSPWCKGLYFTSATLNGVSCIASSLCLHYRYSCIAPIPLLTGSVAYATSVGARAYNSLADCMDPTAGLSTKAVDICIDAATKNWS